MEIKKYKVPLNPIDDIRKHKKLLTNLQVEIQTIQLRVVTETKKNKSRKLYSFPIETFVSFKVEKENDSDLFLTKAIDIIYSENTEDKITTTQSLKVLFLFYDTSPKSGELKGIRFDSIGNPLSIILDDKSSILFCSKEHYFKCLGFIVSARMELKIN